MTISIELLYSSVRFLEKDVNIFFGKIVSVKYESDEFLMKKLPTFFERINTHFLQCHEVKNKIGKMIFFFYTATILTQKFNLKVQVSENLIIILNSLTKLLLND